MDELSLAYVYAHVTFGQAGFKEHQVTHVELLRRYIPAGAGQALSGAGNLEPQSIFKGNVHKSGTIHAVFIVASQSIGCAPPS
jgi:hypothetical protein